jgi:hypothetical protein
LVAGSTISVQTEGLGVRFTDVAQQAGLNITTIYGDEHRNRYLLETTGSGAAFIDYDNDGWQDIFWLTEPASTACRRISIPQTASSATPATESLLTSPRKQDSFARAGDKVYAAEIMTTTAT